MDVYSLVKGVVIDCTGEQKFQHAQLSEIRIEDDTREHPSFLISSQRRWKGSDVNSVFFKWSETE